MKYILIILVIALIGTGYIYREDIGVRLAGSEQKKDKKKDDDKKKDNKEAMSPEVQVIQQWSLPGRLKEVSGISYIDANRFACVQDEEGVMFIYNTASGKIEKEIPFGGAGDYEGITLAGNTAYIVRSDGALFEISNWKENPETKQYETGLTAAHNVEGLVYDKKNNRLLLGIKDNEPSTKDYKGVYAFNLDSKRSEESPVYKIDMKSEAGTGKKKKGFKPSAIGLHPESNDLYVVDGPSSRLMVLNGDGSIKRVVNLGGSFEQPEGITFSPNGELFISSEGVRKPGNISKITVDE